MQLFTKPTAPPDCPSPLPTFTPVTTPPTPVNTAVPTPLPVVPDPGVVPGSAQIWKYTLKFDRPSRIAVMKNALGSTVSVITAYQPPALVCSELQSAVWRAACLADPSRVTVEPVLDSNTWWDPLAGDFTGVGYGYTGGPITVKEINPHCKPPGNPTDVSGCTAWQYTLDYGENSFGTDPGVPLDVIDSPVTGKPKAGVGTWEEEPPAKIIANSATRINWGLIAYSGIESSYSSYATQCGVAGSRNAELKALIDPLGGADVSAIVANLRLESDGGLPVGGLTPTRLALEKAQQALIDTFAGDPLYNCLRNYGTILVTDGESNTCNPAHQPWKKYTTVCPPPDPDIADPDTYTLFPPGVAEDIWNLALEVPCVDAPPREGGPIYPRTWVIGFGSEVGGCELNYTAFKGKTDANSPNNDAGFAWLKDTRLCDVPDGLGGCLTPSAFETGQDYAFFADSTEALVVAFSKITNATATGDYATGAPITGAAAGAGKYIILSSTAFPDWEGHLYKLDTSEYGNADVTKYRIWDAAEKLASKDETTRRIYTWDPTSPTLDMVEITEGNIGALKDIVEDTGGDKTTMTTAVVDFIRGNTGELIPNGTGGFDLPSPRVPRAARLGPLINTVPSIVGSPAAYEQGKVEDHDVFQIDYKDRRPMIWIGANDGMLHAFDFETGDEVVAILPPQILWRQAELRDNFNRVIEKPGPPVTYEKSPTSLTGQPDDLTNIYGVAGSLRFGDVHFGADGYRTVGFLTLAEAGDLVAAIDITHPYPGSVTPAVDPDPEYGIFSGTNTGLPVKILWQKTATELPGLKTTWSLPALAARSFDKWSILFGAGHDESNIFTSNSTVPNIFQLDPVDGTPVTGSAEAPLGNQASTPWVGNQTFADGVQIEHDASAFRSDNLADLGLQADLNGRIWFIDPSKSTSPVVGIDANAVASRVGETLRDEVSQPLYYPPSAGGFGDPPSTGCNVFSFGSGTFYEVSSRVNSLATGQPGSFIPSLYFASNSKNTYTTPIDPDDVLRIPISTIKRCVGCTDTLSPRSQLAAAPYLLIDPRGISASVAVFIIYDPTVGCYGKSYAVAVSFEAPNCSIPLSIQSGTSGATNDTSIPGAIVRTAEMGEGVASGVTSVGDISYTAVACIGEDVDCKADLAEIKDAKAVFGTARAFQPIWWKELR